MKSVIANISNKFDMFKRRLPAVVLKPTFETYPHAAVAANRFPSPSTEWISGARIRESVNLPRYVGG